MSAAAEGGRLISAPVGLAARTPVTNALRVLADMARDELAFPPPDPATRQRLRARLAAIDVMHDQLDAAGPVQLTGPEELVAAVVRAAASQAAYEFDAAVEGIAGRLDPIDGDGADRLMLLLATAAGAVETLVACETGRRGG